MRGPKFLHSSFDYSNSSSRRRRKLDKIPKMAGCGAVALLATYCIVTMIFSSFHMAMAMAMDGIMAGRYNNMALNRRHGPSPGPIGTPSIPRFSTTTPAPASISPIEAEIRPRPDIVLPDATGPERLAALAKHDAMRIGDLNTKINNAIVVREAGNKSAFAGGASFVVNAGIGLFLMEVYNISSFP